MNKPKVSVLFPVYNGEFFLEESINSILNQTFTEFELLILLEYGSNNASRRIITQFNDKRIRIVENSKKLGLAESLNVGMREALGEYIARMDADDISMPARFAKQVRFLDKHPNIVMCGTAMHGLYDDGHHDNRRYFTDPDSIHFECMLGNPFGHPTVMFRRLDFIEKNLFYRNTPYSEDFELWKRVVELFQCANLPQYLLNYRLHEESASFVYGSMLNDVNQELNKEDLKKKGIEYSLEKQLWASGLTIEEIEQREQLLINICNLWTQKRVVHKVLEQRMRTFYVNNDIRPIKRYWKIFSFVYKNNIFDFIRVHISLFLHQIVGALR